MLHTQTNSSLLQYKSTARCEEWMQCYTQLAHSSGISVWLAEISWKTEFPLEQHDWVLQMQQNNKRETSTAFPGCKAAWQKLHVPLSCNAVCLPEVQIKNAFSHWKRPTLSHPIDSMTCAYLTKVASTYIGYSYTHHCQLFHWLGLENSN